MSPYDLNSLLPLGDVISFQGNLRLKIIQRIGSGYTSEVYQGELLPEGQMPIEVAIKAMKNLEFSRAQELFQTEGEVLSALNYQEDEKNKKENTSIRVSPKYYGFSEYNTVPFFVMEFIHGDKIPDLLREKGRFSEAKALTLGWQLFRTLDILHTELNKTFIDLKFENLWLDESNPSMPHLRMTDFGTLEAIKPNDPIMGGVRRDLLIGSLYLFNMLTGKRLRYSMGNLVDRVENALKTESSLSWGARQLLLRILHRNPQARPKNAYEIAAECEALFSFWTMNQDELRATVQEHLANAASESDSQAQREFACLARSSLDILFQRFPWLSEELRIDLERAEAALRETEYLTRGQNLFKGRQYDDAIKVLEEGINWAESTTELRRWLYLSMAGQESDRSIFDQYSSLALQAIEQMSAYKWEMAREVLSRLPTTLRETKGIQALLDECELQQTHEEVEEYRYRGSYSEAANLCNKIQKLIEQMPNRSTLVEEFGDISALQLELEELGRTRELANKKFQEAEKRLRENVLDEAYRKTEEAITLDVLNPDLPNHLKKLSTEAIQGGHYALAERISALYSLSRLEYDELRTWHSLTFRALKLSNARREGNFQKFALVFHDIYSNYYELNREIVEGILIKEFTLALRYADSAKDINAMKELSQLAHTIKIDWQQNGIEPDQIRLKLQNAIRERIDEHISIAKEVYLFLSLGEGLQKLINLPLERQINWLNHPVNALKRAGELLSIADHWAGRENYRKNEILALRNDIQKLMEDVERANQNLQNYKKESAELYRNTIVEQKGRLGKIEQLMQQMEEIDADLKVLSAAHESYNSLWLDTLRRCLDYLATYPEDEKWQEVNRLKDELIASGLMLSVDGWIQLKGMAEERLTKYQSELDRIKNAYFAGKLQEATQDLNVLQKMCGVSEESVSLQQTMMRVAQWKKWEEKHDQDLQDFVPKVELLEELREHLLRPIPKVYWENSRTKEYLMRAKQTTLQEVQNRIHAIRGAGYRAELMQNLAKALRAWLELELISRIAQEKSQTTDGGGA